MGDARVEIGEIAGLFDVVDETGTVVEEALEVVEEVLGVDEDGATVEDGFVDEDCAAEERVTEGAGDLRLVRGTNLPPDLPDTLPPSHPSSPSP